jgi:hypothetical protein
MLAPDEVTDAYIDGFADMLTVDLPAGTVVQFRYAIAPDPGRAIAEHLRSRSYEQAYFPAARLHDLNIDFLKALADTGIFRQEHASLFVRIPVRHENDRSLHGFNIFAAAMISEWREHGLRGFKRRAADHWASSRNDGVVRRIREHEEESLRQAEKYFRLIEMQSPVSLHRVNRERLWRAVYQSHVTGSRSVPRLPQYDGLDLRDYLCAETIEDRGWYVMHGVCPATIVSVFAPGEQFIAADAMRALTSHPGLAFRHTIITEFISIDREKAKAKLDSHIKHVERSGTRADGRYELTPEAEASFNDLKQTRRAITGSREAARIGIGGLAGQCLHLDQERACAFECDRNTTPRCIHHPFCQEYFRRIQNSTHPGAVHLKNADLIGRPKTVFDTPQQPINLKIIAL